MSRNRDLIRARTMVAIGLVFAVLACLPYGSWIGPNVCLAMAGGILFAIGSSIERDWGDRHE